MCGLALHLNWMGILIRRAQALLVILTFLVTPLGGRRIIKKKKAVCPCCSAMSHGKKVPSECPMHHSGSCGAKSQVQAPDFLLAAPAPPVSPFVLTAPSITRADWTDSSPSTVRVFIAPPFSPPRS